MKILSETLWVNRETHRTYRCVAGVDLLGDWFMTRYWGSLDNGCGHYKTTIYPERDIAVSAVRIVRQERQKRGYALIEDRCYD